MPFAFQVDRCEVVAAFTNPTLHRIISQRYFLPIVGDPLSRIEIRLFFIQIIARLPFTGAQVFSGRSSATGKEFSLDA